MKDKKRILDFIFKKRKAETIGEPLVSGDYQCSHCGKQLYVSMDNYITLKGSIFIGDDRLLIGDKDNKDKEIKICFTCLQNSIENAKECVASELFNKISDLQYIVDGLDEVSETKLNFPEFLSQDK